jgi:hypothetical protein
MGLNEKVIIKTLESTIDRLEEARASAYMIFDNSGIEFQGLDVEMAEHIEGAEAAYAVLESRLNEIIHVIAEETDNLRNLLEDIEENST